MKSSFEQLLLLHWVAMGEVEAGERESLKKNEMKNYSCSKVGAIWAEIAVNFNTLLQSSLNF